jgi:glycolate oxidase
MRQAAQAIREIFCAGFLPCAVEVADEFTLAAARKRTGSDMLEGCHAHLIVEVDGQEASVRGELKTAAVLINKLQPRFIQRAWGVDECEKIWRLRREFSYALRDTGLTKLNEDIVVPRGKLEELFQFAARLQRKHRLPIACFGHAGDGNIHVNVMVNLDEPGGKRRANAALDDLFRQVLAWKGVITGEHGIGLAKKRWWPLAADEPVRSLHGKIKAALDPRGILNPGKFI